MAGIRLRVADRLETALRKFSSKKLTVRVGEKIFSEGESSHGCYLIVSGSMRLFIPASKGRAIFETLVEPGCLVGLPATINGQRYSLTCQAAAESELAYLSRQDITRMMSQRSDVALMLLDFLSSEVQTARKQLPVVATLGRRGPVVLH